MWTQYSVGIWGKEYLYVVTSSNCGSQGNCFLWGQVDYLLTSKKNNRETERESAYEPADLI
jgi:hypothetical protein